MVNETGRMIATIRALKGWSQAELARQSEVSHPYISRAENGIVVLSDYHLEKIQKALGISFDAVRPNFRQFAAAVLTDGVSVPGSASGDGQEASDG